MAGDGMSGDDMTGDNMAVGSIKEDGILKILWKYIWHYRFVTAVFLLFGGIFMGMFSLYRLENEAIVYAVILCILCGVAILSIHFVYYYKKHCTLVRMRRIIELQHDELPMPSDLIEEDFCAMIAALQGINQSNRNAWKAERSDSMDYYTTWVHQIKAPIAVMRLILQGKDTGENQELLLELFRIEQYTEMALCYIRLDSTSTDFIIQKLSLDPIIRQAIRKFAPQFVRKKLRLQYEGTNIRVLTDEKWLLFILEQLLANAIKYTETGVVTIDVSTQQVLRITDTGIGIAPEDLPRIFEKGFTGYNGHANKKSTGLGLYLCKRAADQLSHSLSVTSGVGHGTTVAIDLHCDKLEVE